LRRLQRVELRGERAALHVQRFDLVEQSAVNDESPRRASAGSHLGGRGAQHFRSITI